MTKRLIRSLKAVFATLLLTSCNSFNTVHEYRGFNQEYSSLQVAAEQTQPVASEPQESQTEVLCPRFNLPDFGKTPELPLRQLRQIKAGDNAALDALVQKHIRELRAYIGTVKVSIYTTHSEYIKSCKNVPTR